MKALARFTHLLASVLLVSACVTINIYFPAAQAQEAAEKIVEDIIRGDEADEAPPVVPPEQKGSSLVPGGSVPLGSRLLELIVPSAHAAPPRFEADTPEVRRLQASMKNRYASLKPFLDAGAIGFTGDALVAVRDPSAVSLRDRARVEKLVAAENADRDQMYKAIAQANGHPEWEKDVRATFARTWVEQASPGWWYQGANGAWVKK